MANSADPDQLASEETNWSGSTLFAKAGYIQVQQDKAAFTQSERAMTEKERTNVFNVFNSNAVFDTNDGLKGMESRHLVFIPTIFGVT